jgi:hypothetical protein
MDALAVVESAPNQRDYVRDRLRGFPGIRLERERAFGGLDDDDRSWR